MPSSGTSPLICEESGVERYSRKVNQGVGRQEKSSVEYTREGLQMLGRSLGEFAYLGGAILGCAVLGGLGREEDRRWPGRLAGLALGILVIGGVTLGGFANWMPFMDALHVGEAAPLGLVGALARSLGRGPADL